MLDAVFFFYSPSEVDRTIGSHLSHEDGTPKDHSPFHRQVIRRRDDRADIVVKLSLY